MSAPPQPPKWRLRLVQWDMSHNAIPLALFAYTGVFQTFTITDALSIPAAVWHTFFFISLTALILTIILTLLRAFLHPPALINDFFNSRLQNFFFLPVIIGVSAILASPPFLRGVTFGKIGFYLLGSYQSILVLYLFGEWLFATAPTKSIYPLVFMQTIGFFLLSILASTLNLPEQAAASLAVGILLWLLVFMTNFQHVSGALSLKDERPAPTFFLFIAPPAQAAIAVVFLMHAEDNPTSGFLNVSNITDFPDLAKGFFYIDIFLYALMFRLFPTWWRSKFSVSWWAYVFPLSAATCAVIWRYETSQDTFFLVLSIIMFIIATFAVIVVAASTVWAVWTGRLPKNPSREAEYCDYWFEKNVNFDFGVVGVESASRSEEYSV